MKFDWLQRKKGKIVMLTAYDYQMAKLLDEAGVDLILVGDSLGMVVLGHKDTKRVTMQHMLHHIKAVTAGAENTPVVGDMPIRSCKTAKKAVYNAERFLDAGAGGVKIEGNRPEIIEALLNESIPVMGHVGLLPQFAKKYRLKGKKPEEAEKIYQDALELDGLGVFTIVLECIPESLARKITETIEAPTIGIGAGKYCDGQVLVINDMLGFDRSFNPKYLKRYANLHEVVTEAVKRFKKDVVNGEYPDEKHTYH